MPSSQIRIRKQTNLQTVQACAQRPMTRHGCTTLVLRGKGSNGGMSPCVLEGITQQGMARKAGKISRTSGTAQTMQSRAQTFSQEVNLHLSEPLQQLLVPHRHLVAPGSITRPRRAHARFSGLLFTPRRQSLPSGNLRIIHIRMRLQSFVVFGMLLLCTVCIRCFTYKKKP